jgi:hypothetical protein
LVSSLPREVGLFVNAPPWGKKPKGTQRMWRRQFIQMNTQSIKKEVAG